MNLSNIRKTIRTPPMSLNNHQANPLPASPPIIKQGSGKFPENANLRIRIRKCIVGSRIDIGKVNQGFWLHEDHVDADIY